VGNLVYSETWKAGTWNYSQLDTLAFTNQTANASPNFHDNRQRVKHLCICELHRK